jgi:hypothetical protein
MSGNNFEVTMQNGQHVAFDVPRYECPHHGNIEQRVMGLLTPEGTMDWYCVDCIGEMFSAHDIEPIQAIDSNTSKRPKGGV